MKSLSELTAKIRQWNMTGFSLLPSLQIAIIHSQSLNAQTIQFLNVLDCKELLYNEQLQLATQIVQPKILDQALNVQQKDNIEVSRINEKQIAKEIIVIQPQVPTKQAEQIMLQKKQFQMQKWDHRLKNSIYAIFLVNKNVQARVHLIIDQQIEGQIMDQNFKKTKNIIERLKRNKNMIFVNFNSSIHRLDVMSEHLQFFGLSYRSKEHQIKADQLLFFRKNPLSKQIQRLSSHKNHKNTKKDIINTVNIDKSVINQPKNQTKCSNVKESQSKFDTKVKQKLNETFKFAQLNLAQILMTQIQKKYTDLFGVQINRNFNEMKRIHKQMILGLKSYNQVLEFVNNSDLNVLKSDKQWNQNDIFLSQRHKKLTGYALKCLYRTKQYLVASLMGTYSNVKIQNQSFSDKNKNMLNKRNSVRMRSIHWETMQLMNQIWDIEGDALMKQIDKMPISYIKQRYKMLDYQTIGGFMPSSCFQAIFSLPLRKTLTQILQTLQIIEMKILTTIKQVIEYFFGKTNICYDFSDHQQSEIRKLCSSFRRQTQKVLKSQIQFISTSSEDFWSFKQVKSNLYAPDQQIYIQIKYIGKNYIKKVFDNIKETLPRLIGQNLLKQIVLHLQTKTLGSLTKILHENPIEIQVRQDQIRYIQKIRAEERKIDKLIYFFSLRTNSATSIKNLNEKLQKNWRRMYKNDKSTIQNQEESDSKTKQKKGFISWALNLIKRNNKKQAKRSSSQQKSSNSQKNKIQENPEVQNIKKQNTLSEKNWLLIINIDKQVERQKILKSSQQGFPERLRPTIWHYLAKKQMGSKTSKIQNLLDKGQAAQKEQKKQLEQIFRQIQKDVLRTPPASLFRLGYLKESLTRVLRAYAISDKDLRYTQGMNFIVGIILCVLTHYGQKCQYLQENLKSKTYFQSIEQKCFLIFVFMMEKKGLRKIMFIERATITDLCIRLQDYIRQRSTTMAQKIDRSGFTIEMIFSGALISALTTSQINFSLQKRVIDMLITHEFTLLYKIIGQFVASAQSLCQKMQNENLYYFLKGKFYNQVFTLIGEEGLAKMFNNL